MMNRKPIPPTLQPLLPQLDLIKKKVEASDYNYAIAKDIDTVREKLAKINPFNLYLFDMYSEAEKLKIQPPGPISSQNKQILILKTQFWKEKINDSVANLIE